MQNEYIYILYQFYRHGLKMRKIIDFSSKLKILSVRKRKITTRQNPIYFNHPPFGKLIKLIVVEENATGGFSDRTKNF